MAQGIGCASGTDALLLPLMALAIGPGDEVITSPYTFFATAGSIWRTGAKPVFVDIEPDTYNIDPAGLKRRSRRATRAVIPVHLYGQPPTWIRSWRSLGSTGYSYSRTQPRPSEQPTRASEPAGWEMRRLLASIRSKNLGGFGDGGLMTTSDPVLGRSLARLRVHGMEPKYHHQEVGLNSRLDALQAAVLRVKLGISTHGPKSAARSLRDIEPCSNRNGSEARHDTGRATRLFSRVQSIRDPRSRSDPRPAPRTSDACQIGTEIYYPIPLHLQPCFAALGHTPGDFPHSESAAKETIALPMYPELTEEQQQFVVGAIRPFLRAACSRAWLLPTGRRKNLDAALVING